MVDYREQKCTKCGNVGLYRVHIIDTETGVDKGHLGCCDECEQLHDCGDYAPDGTGKVHEVITA